MATKEHILEEIRRVTTKLGRAPGRHLFEQETGVRMPEWYGIYWSRWGDALVEAGLEANEKNPKLSSEVILGQYAKAVRHFGKIPSEGDVRLYGRERKDFPSHSTFFKHFRNKVELVAVFSDWVRSNEEYSDLLPLLPSNQEPEEAPAQTDAIREGSVYLLRSGDHYKIGRSDQLEQRIKQITISLPDKVTLEHTIRTDDPPGIEAYWHRRFAEKRANGEWFRLTKVDVLAFKKRKFQ